MALKRSAHIYKGNIIGGSARGGGGGGATTLNELDNVSISNVQDGQALVYDESTGQWINADGTAADVEPLSEQDVNNLINQLNS